MRLSEISYHWGVGELGVRRVSRRLLGCCLLVLLLIGSAAAQAQPELLVFSKTDGFRHGSIGAATTAIEQLGANNGFAVVATENAAQFTDANLLNASGQPNYAAVVFLMTTGDVLNGAQQAAFERYIQAGGGYVGVHSASDTEYGWAWYGGLVGAYFDRHPSQQNATLTVEDSNHPSTSTLPTTWQRFDEWYDFQTNPRDTVNVLISIDESSYSGGGMGADHPMVWYHEYDGGRAWYTALGHTSASYSEPEFLDHLLGGIRYAGGLLDEGPLTVSADRQFFQYRDSGRPFFMAGVGGPEGFLFETDARKQQIVDQLISSGANALYMHTIRSFEGDGFNFEDPFNTNQDINSGVDSAVLQNWLGYLEQLDAANIVSWIHIIDDTARPWGCNVPLSQAAKDYIETIVTTFRDLDHLVWLSGEEYQMGSCNSAQDKALMSAIAAEIRLHDSVHPLGVHHNNGQSMAFDDDPNVNVFAQQICGANSVRNPEGVHNAAQRGNWVYVMSECHPWHLQLLHNNDRTAIRRSNWATAMAGGYVLLYNAYECNETGRLCSRNAGGNPDTGNDPHDPTPAMLADLTRLHEFMAASRFNELNPNDGLAAGGTQWVLANPTSQLYLGYAGNGPGTIGFDGLGSGTTYALSWFNPITGAIVNQSRPGSDSPFPLPAGFGAEAALFAVGDGMPPGNRAPFSRPDSYQTATNTELVVAAAQGVLANDSDADGDTLTATVVSDPTQGGLVLNTDGSFRYQPDTDFSGSDSFSYTASDGELSSGTTDVTLSVSQPGVVTLWLVNAASDQRVAQLNNGDRIDFTAAALAQFNIEATVDDANSVQFLWSGLLSGTRTENVAPYAMFGDNNGDFNGNPVAIGSLSVTASAFDAGNAGGNEIAVTTISFEFVESTPVGEVVFADGFEN